MAAIGGAKLSEEDLAATYGFALAVLNSDPSLKDVFKKAVKGQWTSERFQASVMQTIWFRNRSDSQRNYQIMKQTDPAKFIAEVNRTMTTIADQWGELTGQSL